MANFSAFLRTAAVKRAAVAAAAALVIGGGAIGITSAQQAASPTPNAPAAAATPQPGAPQARHQAFIAALAAKLGVSPDKLQQSIDEVRKEQGIAGPGKPGWHRPGGFGGLDAAAKSLGLTDAQLRQELGGGK